MSRRRRPSDEASVIGRIQRLPRQLEALEVALQRFSGDDGRIDAGRWDAAFRSPDPETIVAVTAVTGLYEGLVNHLLEMLHGAARLVALPVATGPAKPQAPALIDAVVQNGGLSRDRGDDLLRLVRVRNALQHASLDVGAEQARDAVELLRSSFRDLLRAYVVWLRRHGVDLLSPPA
jgi:uncharacterized protein YutE (UPF0331/DUF86 family)